MLYDYYANTLNPIYHKRNFDEIDRASLTGFHVKRNFDEIDRTGLSGFYSKKNFDEIDRSSLSGLIHKKRYASGMPTGLRFNEIDRNGFNDFMKRYYNEEHGMTSGGSTKYDDTEQIGGIGRGFAKKNFDEIDRSALNGLKRNTRKAANESSATNNEQKQQFRKD